jgi:hypothetical protein
MKSVLGFHLQYFLTYSKEQQLKVLPVDQTSLRIEWQRELPTHRMNSTMRNFKHSKAEPVTSRQPSINDLDVPMPFFPPLHSVDAEAL